MIHLHKIRIQDVGIKYGLPIVIGSTVLAVGYKFMKNSVKKLYDEIKEEERKKIEEEESSNPSYPKKKKHSHLRRKKFVDEGSTGTATEDFPQLKNGKKVPSTAHHFVSDSSESENKKFEKKRKMSKEDQLYFHLLNLTNKPE